MSIKQTKQNKTPHAKPIRIRCIDTECKHEKASSYFGEGLFILTAPIGCIYDVDDLESYKKKITSTTKFTLWETTSKGVLQPLASDQFDSRYDNQDGIAAANYSNENLKKPTINEHQLYAVYIIVHFDLSFAKKCLTLINSDDTNPFDTFGNPHTLEAIISAKKTLEFQVPNHKQGFIPANKIAHNSLKEKNLVIGHKNYDYQVLFENMPNAKCSWVRDNIFKLQLHLGHMRYPIGGVHNPYYPCDRTKKSIGIFEKKTYNSIFAFHKDAKSGHGIKVSNHNELFDKMFHQNTFNPKDRAPIIMQQTKHPSLQPKFSNAFLHTVKSSPPSFQLTTFPTKTYLRTTTPFVFADEKLGDAINHWLTNGFRKKGHILVSRPQGFNKNKSQKTEKKAADWMMLWMRDDFANAFDQWNDYLIKLGIPYGIMGSWTYRDIYTGIAGGIEGMAVQSLHKTGLAIDLPGKGFVSSRDVYPFVFEKEVTPIGREKFRLFMKIENPLDHESKTDINIIRDKLITYRMDKCGVNKDNKFWHANGYHKKEYKEHWGIDSEKLANQKINIFSNSVCQWKYNAKDKNGGTDSNPINDIFLDLTVIGEAFGIERINSYREGWKLGKTFDLKNSFSSFNSFAKTLSRLFHKKPNATGLKVVKNNNTNIAYTNMQKLIIINKMNNSIPRLQKRSSRKKCYICKKKLQNNNVVRDIETSKKKRIITAHESCYEHAKTKFLNDSFQSKSNLSSIEHLNPDFMYQWALTLKNWKNIKLLKNRSSKLRFIPYPKPCITVSLPELLSLNSEILSTNEVLKESKFLITYEKNSAEIANKIITGKNIYNYICAYSGWNIQFRPRLNKQREKLFAKPNKKVISNDNTLNKWRSIFINTKFKIDKYGYVIIKPGEELTRFFNFIEKNNFFSKKTLMCSIARFSNRKKTDNNQEYVVPYNRHYKKPLDRFIRYVDGWKCHITPQLNNEGNPFYLDECSVKIPREGQPRTMEWWHYQYDKVAYKDGKRASWFKLMEDIGWTEEGLRYIGYNKK